MTNRETDPKLEISHLIESKGTDMFLFLRKHTLLVLLRSWSYGRHIVNICFRFVSLRNACTACSALKYLKALRDATTSKHSPSEAPKRGEMRNKYWQNKCHLEPAWNGQQESYYGDGGGGEVPLKPVLLARDLTLFLTQH